MRKFFTYLIIMLVSAIIYMAIFYLIFFIMFKNSSPSIEIITLNFFMIFVVLLLIPAGTELATFFTSATSKNKIDLVYIIKKLSKISPRSSNLDEIASFLAKHMHYDYIGICVNGKIYSSNAKRKFPTGSAKLVEGLGDPEHGVWQEFDETSPVWQKLDLSAIAALRTASGKTFGQVLVGKPKGKVKFTHHDLIQVETIINLVAVIIDSGINNHKSINNRKKA